MRTYPLGLLLLFLAPAVGWASNDAPLKPRAEVNWRLGHERSILMSEIWVPLHQDGNGLGSDRVFYGDLRLMGDDHDNSEFNLGAGYREITSVGNQQGIAGVNAWFDRRRTERGAYFSQITLGGEWLAENWDARVNAYLPLSDEKVYAGGGGGTVSSDPFLEDTGIYYLSGGGGQLVEEPLRGIDFEMGWKLPFTDSFSDSTRVYGALYHFEGDHSEDVSGWRARVTTDITPDFSVGARFQRDDERGAQGFLEATVRFPFGQKKSYKADALRARLDESPERDIDIVTGVADTFKPLEKKQVLNSETGTAQRVIYVDNSNAAAGDGSLENPYQSLTAAQAALNSHDVLYIAYGSGDATHMNDGLLLDKDGVMVIGSGSDFIFDNNRFTTSSAGAGNGFVLRAAGSRPVIGNQNVNGDGIVMAANNLYITGLSIENAQRHGIYAAANGGATLDNLVIDNVRVDSSVEDGIHIQASGAGSLARAAIINSDITNNKNGIRFYAYNDASLETSLQASLASGNAQHGVILYDDSTAGSIDADLGGGARSTGGNGLFGNTLEDVSVELDGGLLMAQNNWWGQASGLYQQAPGGGMKPQIYFGAPINEGLMGHWTMDAEWVDGTTAYDRSGNNYHGTMLGGLTASDLVAGDYRDGLYFNGATAIDLVNSDIFMPANNSEITALVSFNADTIPGDYLSARLLNFKQGALSSNLFLNVGGNDYAGYYSPQVGGVSIGDTLIDEGSFYQSAIAYDGTTYRPYLDGAADSNTRAANLSGGFAVPTTIGAFAMGDTHFTGIIDDVRIYNRALNPGEIAEINRMNTSSSVNSLSHMTSWP